MAEFSGQAYAAGSFGSLAELDAEANSGVDDQDGEEVSLHVPDDDDTGLLGGSEGVADVVSLPGEEESDSTELLAESVQADSDYQALVIDHLGNLSVIGIVLVVAVFACFGAICCQTLLRSFEFRR